MIHAHVVGLLQPQGCLLRPSQPVVARRLTLFQVLKAMLGLDVKAGRALGVLVYLESEQAAAGRAAKGAPGS